MNNKFLKLDYDKEKLTLVFSGELTLYILQEVQGYLFKHNISQSKKVIIDLENITYLDTAFALFLSDITKRYRSQVLCTNENYLHTLKLVAAHHEGLNKKDDIHKRNFFESLGKYFCKNYLAFLSFMTFVGKIFSSFFLYFKNSKNIRYKEIAFEINESTIRALPIVALTSFLIGLVVAYQSAYQLRLYGANIFIVDMLGLSIFRELAPLITAIVIAGRSGSSYTAQIGAMKITQEIDAMQTMGFDPFSFLVLPRIIALIIMFPILIFVADMMAMLGGIIVADVSLNITPSLFLDRFNEVIAIKHFYVGIVKGPFFAFLIASIGIYRGLIVKDDTQSIGFNTTKSVVESLFAVIVCDAIFSIAFTNLGI